MHSSFLLQFRESGINILFKEEWPSRICWPIDFAEEEIDKCFNGKQFLKALLPKKSSKSYFPKESLKIVFF